MQKMLEGKTILVTGAGGGIGRAIAVMAAKEGANVVVNDLGGSASGEGQASRPANDVVSEIEKDGGKAIANTGSVCDAADAHKMVEQAVDVFGRIDGVVNNAGILRDRMFHKMSTSEWSAVIDTHLNGSYNVARAAATFFREQGGGAYVNMTSTSGLIGNLGQSNYAAAKLGVMGMSRIIALDLARYNVRSNCIAPFAWSRLIGTIPTETPEQKARVEKIKQMTPEKVAPLAVFLLSDAAKDVSGQIFGSRKNEIFVFSQPRPVRSVHHEHGWDAKTIAEMALPSLKASFTPLEVSGDVFSWDPI